MAQNERTLLLRILEDAYDHKGWHGPTLRHVVRGVDAHQAFWQPPTGGHSIWELVLHCAYWKHAVWRRLTGVPTLRAAKFPRDGKNFFPIAEPARRAWRDDLALLGETHQTLRRAVEEAPLSVLQAKARQVYGVAAHDVYHAGQIQLLKRMYRR